ASADQGATISASVTATNSAGSTTAVSAATGIVQAATAPASTPANTSLPVISGTAQVGSQLTASTGSWSGSPTSYAYQWWRCGADCSALTVATRRTYLLASADQGATIRASVTATNSAGSTVAVSAPTGVVQAPVVPPTTAVPSNTSLP